MFEALKKKIKKELTDPLKDKGRVMKLEYLLSSKYTIIGVVIGADILLLILLTFISNIIACLPGILTGRLDGRALLSIRQFIPDLRGITFGGILITAVLLCVMDVFLVFRIRTSWSDKNFSRSPRGNKDENVATLDFILFIFTVVLFSDGK